MMTKALTTEADAVFLDLEDAVSADEKVAARQTAIKAIRDLDWKGHGKTISLRVNGLDTVWTTYDLIEVIEAVGDKLDTVILPKTGCPKISMRLMSSPRKLLPQKVLPLWAWKALLKRLKGLLI